MTYMRNIVVVPYDPGWPRRYEAEEGRLRRALDGVLQDIAHVGSTAIPGMAAKPLIDIMLVVGTLDDLDRRTPALEALGYASEGALFVPRSRFFSKGAPESRSHHLHAYPPGHPEIDRHLDLRDFLRCHAAEAGSYAALKARLAKEFRDDLPAYSEGKTPMLAALIEQAGRWRAGRAG